MKDKNDLQEQIQQFQEALNELQVRMVQTSHAIFFNN